MNSLGVLSLIIIIGLNIETVLTYLRHSSQSEAAVTMSRNTVKGLDTTQVNISHTKTCYYCCHSLVVIISVYVGGCQAHINYRPCNRFVIIRTFTVPDIKSLDQEESVEARLPEISSPDQIQSRANSKIMMIKIPALSEFFICWIISFCAKFSEPWIC